MHIPATTAATKARMRVIGVDFLLLGLDSDFFLLAAPAPGREIVKEKVEDTKNRGFMF